MKTLEELGVADNTIVMFASDNGPEVPTVNAMRRDHKHDGARPWRGVKRDQWEGGHRTPFIVRWPGTVKAGSTSGEITSLTDFFAWFSVSPFPCSNISAQFLALFHPVNGALKLLTPPSNPSDWPFSCLFRRSDLLRVG